MEIDAISGSEHSANSWHYEENTMDLSFTTPVHQHEEVEDFRRSFLQRLESNDHLATNSAHRHLEPAELPSCATLALLAEATRPGFIAPCPWTKGPSNDDLFIVPSVLYDANITVTYQ